MRKNSVIKLNRFLSIIFAIVMFFGVAMFFCNQSQKTENKTVFAASNEFDNATEIYFR